MDFSFIIPIILGVTLIAYILVSLNNMKTNNVWKDFNQTFIPENSQQIINKKINIQSIEESSLEEQAVKNMNDLTSSYPSTSRAQPLLDENAGSLL